MTAQRDCTDEICRTQRVQRLFKSHAKFFEMKRGDPGATPEEVPVQLLDVECSFAEEQRHCRGHATTMVAFPNGDIRQYRCGLHRGLVCTGLEGEVIHTARRWICFDDPSLLKARPFVPGEDKSTWPDWMWDTA